MSMNRDEAFFWPSVVLTVIMVAAVIVVAFYSSAFAIVAGILLLIWLAERISNLTRPRFYARTEGPPAREVLWKGKRFSRGELEQRIVKGVGWGNPKQNRPGGFFEGEALLGGRARAADRQGGRVGQPERRTARAHVGPPVDGSTRRR